MDYQNVAKKISDFIVFKSQLYQFRDRLESLEANPPNIEKELLTWEEAVAFSKKQNQYKEDIKKLRMSIGNRLEILEGREQEIAKLLPIQNHFILIEVSIDGKIEKYKLGNFPETKGFVMEKLNA